ncbi:hypothetical protein FDB14_17510 [Clostridium botulinum]|nr:hypothetical protein [Clostridium botulinum]NFK69430.1 hypothetical protein [Clostridium botulinum]NFK97962.1 hypothetical protein [Clostridium botulinum]
MVTKELKDNLLNKVSKKEGYFPIESDVEYYYAAGQCISFMCYRYTNINKGLNKDLVSKQTMLSENYTDLKKRIKMLFGKCSNMLYQEDKKFNNCLAAIMGYIPECNNINVDALQLGYLENNILK